MNNKNVPRRTFSLFLVFTIFLMPFLQVNLNAEIYYPTLTGESNVLIDADTNVVFLNDNIDKQVEIGSLTKVMTLYLIMQKVTEEKIDTEKEITIGSRASGMKPANDSEGVRGQWFNTGTKISIQKLIELLIIYSDNGAAIQLAEWVAGNESEFVKKMNEEAKKLKMNSTKFYNATGLAPSFYKYSQITNNGNNVSTAQDLSIVSAKLIENFPTVVNFTSQLSISYAGYNYESLNQLLQGSILARNGVKGLQAGEPTDKYDSFIGYYDSGTHRYISVTLNVNNKTESTAQAQAVVMYDWIDKQEMVFVQLLTADNVYLKETIMKSGIYGLDLYPQGDIFSLKNKNISMNLVRKEYNPDYFTEDGMIYKDLPKGKVVETMYFKISDANVNFNTVESNDEFKIDLVAKKDLNKPNIFMRFINSIIITVENYYTAIVN